jgi:hypothetical protein
MTRDDAANWAKYAKKVNEMLDRYAEAELGWGYDERRGFGQGTEAADRMLLELGHEPAR